MFRHQVKLVPDFVWNRNLWHILNYGLETKNQMETICDFYGTSWNSGGLVCRKGRREKKSCRTENSKRVCHKGE